MGIKSWASSVASSVKGTVSSAVSKVTGGSKTTSTSTKTTTPLSQSKLGSELSSAGYGSYVSGSSGITTTSGVSIGGGGGGSGGSVAPSQPTTQIPTTPEQEKSVKGFVKELIPSKKDKLGLGVAPVKTVEVVKPLTLKEQAEAKRIQLRSLYTGIITRPGVSRVLENIQKIGVVREPILSLIKGEKYQYKPLTEQDLLSVPDVAYTPGQPPKEKELTEREKEAREQFKIGLGGQIAADNKVQKVLDYEVDVATKNYNANLRNIQEDYDKGKINYDKAVEKSDKLYEETNRKLSNEINRQVKTIYEKQIDLTRGEIKQRQEDWAKKGELSIPQRALTGGVIAGSWAIPFAGPAFAAGDIAGTIKSAPDIALGLRTEPIKTVSSMAPELVGGVLTLGTIAGIKNSMASSQLKAQQLATQKNLKLSTSNSLQVGKAIKVGTDSAGRTIWKVEVKGISKIKNIKTGKVLDTIKTIGYADVVTKTAGQAQKAVVKSVTTDLRAGGVRVSQLQNKITLKGDLTKATGAYDVFRLKDNLIFAKGKVPDITSTTLRIKATPEQLITKARMPSITGRTAMADALFKRVARYKEVKTIKEQKIKGVEEIYRGRVLTDLYKNLIDVKGYTRKIVEPLKIKVQKIKPYRRKPSIEPKPFRDVAEAYQKVFIPKKIKDASSFITGQRQTPSVKLRKVTGRTVAEISAKAQLKAMTDVASLKRIEQIKTKPIKVRTQQVKMQDISRTLFAVRVRERASVTEAKTITRTVQVSRVKQKDLKKMFAILGGQPITKTKVIFQERALEQQRVSVATRQAQQQYQRQIQRVGSIFKFAVPTTPTPRIVPTKIPIIRIPIPKPTYEYKYDKPKRITKAEKKRQAQIRKYQASVASVSFNIVGEEPKRRITGLEVRPIVGKAKRDYLNRVNKAFSL